MSNTLMQPSQETATIEEMNSLLDDEMRAKEVATPYERRGKNEPGEECQTDIGWSMANLRSEHDSVILDLANVLRVFERHPEYKGRFLFNKDMGKVIDRGVMMVSWQIDVIAAELQERFLPGISEDIVHRAVYIAANKAALKR